MEAINEELLQEGWKDQIPPRFREFIDEIDNAALEEKRPAQVLSNYFFKLIILNRTRANNLYNWFIWGLGSETRKAIESYEEALSKLDPNNPDVQQAYNAIATQLKKAKAFKDWTLSEDTRKQSFQHHLDTVKLEQAGDNLGMLRQANKVIKSVTKQAKKWLEKNWPESADFLMQKATSVLNAETRKAQEADLQSYYDRYTNSIWADLTRAVHKPDNVGPLEAFYKKNKDMPRNEFMDEIEDYLQELLFPVEKKPCATVGREACTLLTLPNGMFWYNLGTDQCTISANKLNNCGQAQRNDSVLINLMSDKDGLKWHVMVEYNAPTNKIIQVLGNSNQVPNKKYWEPIKALINKFPDVILDKDAWLHVKSPEDQIEEFVDAVGLSTMAKAKVESWEAMEGQINEDFYAERAMETRPVFKTRYVNFNSAGTDQPSGPASKVALLELVISSRHTYFYQTPTREKEYAEKYAASDAKKLKELAESTEFKKQAYDALIPEKFQELIKFSNIRRVRAKNISTGTFRFQMKIEFELSIAGWTKEKGEMYADGFVDLSNEIMNNLDDWMIQMGFMVAPERYAKSYPEQARMYGTMQEGKLTGSKLLKIVEEIVRSEGNFGGTRSDQ
jgi:hypothetical protein